jgi:regulator of sigma E protease
MQFLSYLTDAGLFALLFFLLVFFHELGHFLMAKWMGIRVEKFSIGMGPAIFTYKYGDTEYRIAILPLGGYVKMSGDDPTKEYSEEEKKVGFLTQKPPAKLLVVFGGPLFNLILPLFVYALMLSIGVPSVDSVVGTLEPDNPAMQAGLQSGDRIVALNGKPVRKWKELESVVRESAGKELSFEVERLNFSDQKLSTKEIKITPELQDGRSRFGEPIKVGKIGVSPAFPIPLIYFEDKAGSLATAGLKPFDRIVSVDGLPITSLDEWDRFLSLTKKSETVVEYRRGQSEDILKTTLQFPKNSKDLKKDLGLLPISLVVGEVNPEGRAKKAGIIKGDRLVAIGGTVLSSWEEVPGIIRGSEGAPLEFVWARDGKEMSATISAEKTTIEDPLLGTDNPLAVQEIFRVGIAPRLEVEQAYVEDQSFNPITWVTYGVNETWRLIDMTVTALYKLVTGQISLKLLGSPIMIYKVAGNTYRMAGGGHYGWIAFLTNLALLSVTLGLVNLLPIPVLDGGHATFFMIEWIRGRPVSVKVMEIAMQVGLFILIALFALVLYNDVERYSLLGKFLKVFQ